METGFNDEQIKQAEKDRDFYKDLLLSATIMGTHFEPHAPYKKGYEHDGKYFYVKESPTSIVIANEMISKSSDAAVEAIVGFAGSGLYKIEYPQTGKLHKLFAPAFIVFGPDKKLAQLEYFINGKKFDYDEFMSMMDSPLAMALGNADPEQVKLMIAKQHTEILDKIQLKVPDVNFKKDE